MTLVQQANASCAGIVYELPENKVDQILRALDVREQGGYVREQLQVQGRNQEAVAATTWIAHPSNKNYLGPSTHSDIASHIASSVGPSGTNLDYFERLVTALAMLNASEAHTRRISRWLSGRTSVFRQM